MRPSTMRALLVATALAMLACEDSITNPGPIRDGDLNQSVGHAAVVNGMSLAFSRALNHIAFTGGAASREIAASGTQGGLFGITLRQRQGILDPGVNETNLHWQLAQQARWVAEDGVRRLRAALGDGFAASPLAAQALLHVGYANRLLGENMCEAVIDGGPSQPRRVHFERAEAAFTEALAIADGLANAQLANAARAGRASVRVWLDDWPGAAADAQSVPAGFVYQATYTTTESDQYNRFYWANANQPWRSHTVSGTFYEDYFTETGDPRTPWDRNPQFPTGADGIPWLFQTKYTRRDAPITLSSGREMQLILAEALLRAGDATGALEIINGLRFARGVPPWPAGTLVEVWTALKRERGIELWLEGRQLGDLSRWLSDGTPGQAEDMTGRSTCFPIGQSEIASNPNL